MATRHKFDKTEKRDIIYAIRDFAKLKLKTQDKQHHINWIVTTILTGKRYNAPELFNFVRTNVKLSHWVTDNSIHNLARRAVGKGSVTDSASPEAIYIFNTWVPSTSLTTSITSIAQRSKYADVRPTQSGVIAAQQKQIVERTTVKPQPPVKKQPKVKATPKVVPVVELTDIEKLQNAISTAQFTATELLTRKFTIVEFLTRIGVLIK